MKSNKQKNKQEGRKEEQTSREGEKRSEAKIFFHLLHFLDYLIDGMESASMSPHIHPEKPIRTATKLVHELNRLGSLSLENLNRKEKNVQGEWMSFVKRREKEENSNLA